MNIDILADLTPQLISLLVTVKNNTAEQAIHLTKEGKKIPSRQVSAVHMGARDRVRASLGELKGKGSSERGRGRGLGGCVCVCVRRHGAQRQSAQRLGASGFLITSFAGRYWAHKEKTASTLFPASDWRGFDAQQHSARVIC